MPDIAVVGKLCIPLSAISMTYDCEVSLFLISYNYYISKLLFSYYLLLFSYYYLAIIKLLFLMK